MLAFSGQALLSGEVFAARLLLSYDFEPAGELGIEIISAGECSSRKEGCLQVGVEPFNYSLGLWIIGFGLNEFDTEGSTELGNFAPDFSVPADSCLVVSQQSPRHPAKGGDRFPHA